MSTPVQQQIAGLKREAGEAILLTRMGDFYEIIGEDAVKAAPALEIALTTRGKGTDSETPMCGVPHFALESYLPKLLGAGFSAAIAEPTARPEEVKGLLPRAIKRIITPGDLARRRRPLAGLPAPPRRERGGSRCSSSLRGSSGSSRAKGPKDWTPRWSDWRPRS